MSFYPETLKLWISKFLKLGLPWFWKPVTSCAYLRLIWGLKQSYNSHRELFNNMCHATYMQVNWGDSWLLVVSLTLNLSFDHNLCCKYPNGWCKPILNIYVSRNFQWYNFFFNLVSFDPCTPPLKIWDSIGIPIPKMGTHLGMWVHALTLPYTPESMKCDSHDSLLAHTFINICFDRESKVRVTTTLKSKKVIISLVIAFKLWKWSFF